MADKSRAMAFVAVVSNNFHILFSCAPFAFCVCAHHTVATLLLAIRYCRPFSHLKFGKNYFLFELFV